MSDNQATTYRLIPIAGMPCAGKDTTGEFLQGLVPNSRVLSSGDTIREAQNPAHPLHDELKGYQSRMVKGTLFPDVAILNLEDPLNSVFPFMVENALKDGVTTLISTGVPRTYDQLVDMYRYFEARLPGEKIHMDFVFLDVDPVLLEERMHKRTAQRIAEGKKPREEDNVVTLPERIKTYNELTLPMIKASGENVIRINANGPIAEVNQVVLEALEARSPLGIPYLSGESFTPRSGKER